MKSLPPLPGEAVSLPSEEDIQGLFRESEVSTNLIYTFPQRLIDCFRAVKNDHAPSLLDQESVVRESAFSSLANLQNRVGFRQDDKFDRVSLVNFRFLGDEPVVVKPGDLREAGCENPAEAAEKFNAILRPHYRNTQAYCGWLLQQEMYWDDLAVVIGLFGDRFKDELLPQQVFAPPEGAELVEEPHESTLAFKAFCEKWRLQGMATLDLPVVVEPQFTPVTLYTPNSYPGSVTPFMPDIFPVDAKGPIASSLDDARMGIDAPHLEEWKSLISISSREKKRIDRYARQFCLQHYWRILLQRYPKQLHKRKSDIGKAFSRYFGIGDRVISRDSHEMAILTDRNLSTFL